MRYSRMLIPTLREAPSDAEVTSHKLMMRAGYIRKLAAGIYTYLPLCLRVLTKIETIVREEMARAGAQELLLPVVMPAELWKETGRWNYYGKELLRFKDRHDRDFCMGPTHEEAITDLVRSTVRSWRELPKNLFQIQTKFRDEIRPRFGLMRGREFLMKDGYSFDADEAAAKTTYKKMVDAYETIFARCGLHFRAVEAGTGTIGGSLSHEFQVLAASGEDEILACDACKYAANVEKAEVRGKPETRDQRPQTKGKFKKVSTPGRKTVEEVAPLLKLKPMQFVKTLIFETNKGIIAGLVRGDHNIKDDKFRQLVGCEWCHLAEEKLIQQATQSPSGYLGPVGLKIPIFADQEILQMENFCTGANEKDTHLVDVNPGDFKIEKVGDIRAAVEGDGCPRCDRGRLKVYRGIEVGQIFYLGTQYSRAMKAVYLDKQGKEQVLEMGCYGIGIGRTAAAAIEQNHDEKGIVWPKPIAPFQVEVLSLNQDACVLQAAEKIYQELQGKGVEVLYDDRDERAGVKFADADLIGIPYFIVVGSKGLKDNRVELKTRKTGVIENVPTQDIIRQVESILRD